MAHRDKHPTPPSTEASASAMRAVELARSILKPHARILNGILQDRGAADHTRGLAGRAFHLTVYPRISTDEQ